MAWICLLCPWVVRLKPRHVVLQIFLPSGASLCDLPVPGAQSSWEVHPWWGRLGSRGFWNPPAFPSWGVPQSSQAALVATLRGDNLCHHWEDDDGGLGMTFGKMERPSQCGSSTSEGITKAVCYSSRVENNCVSHGQQLVRKTEQTRFLKSTSETKILILFLLLIPAFVLEAQRFPGVFFWNSAVSCKANKTKINPVQALQGLCPLFGHVIFNFFPPN